MISKAMVCALMVFSCSDAQAVVSLAGTRLVFDGRFREATIEVSNPGKARVLIQTWLADPRAPKGGSAQLPFVVTPHLEQLPTQGKQILRVLYEGVGMPTDRESLLHLYVLEVPRRSDASQQLSIAIRQRINVFYRPKGLAGNPANAAEKLSWRWTSVDHAALGVRNPTPFHVVLHRVAIDDFEVCEDLILEPFSERSLPVIASSGDPAKAVRLSFKALTDYGGQRDFCALAQESQPFNARLRMPGAQLAIGKC